MVQIRLDALRLERPRQWGACWMGDELWRMLELDHFFARRLGVSREGTDWEKVLRILTIYRLLSPGSEWRLHRHWFGTTALSDLLGVDGRAVQDDTLYRCLDLLLPRVTQRRARVSRASSRRAIPPRGGAAFLSVHPVATFVTTNRDGARVARVRRRIPPA